MAFRYLSAFFFRGVLLNSAYQLCNYFICHELKKTEGAIYFLTARPINVIIISCQFSGGVSGHPEYHMNKSLGKGRFLVGRKTNCKKFRKKCKEMNDWLRKIRNYKKPKEWWLILQAKLRGHYQYYGVSGNMRSIKRYYRLTMRMTLKWLNRRSQRKSFSWKKFEKYLEHYPLPKPKIVHKLYTLSSDM